MSNSNATGDAQKSDREKKEIVQVPLPPDFDLESYMSNYSGHTKIERYIFIAEHCQPLAVEATTKALAELKNTNNTGTYRTLAERATEKLGPNFKPDMGWIESTEKRALAQQERLEMELNGFKTNFNKEAIKNGYNELGEFFYNRGDLNAALKAFTRTRDYSTTSKHIIQFCLNVIKVAIEMGNYAHVQNHVTKAEQTPDLTDKLTIAKLKICAGLSSLENRKYKVAAKKILETTIDLNNNYNEVIAPQDVAYYGALCSLATFDRADLKKKVIDNITFRSFLELTPELRELINDFYASRYASCLAALDKLKPRLLLDIHLHQHVESLYQKIRSKALIQYFSPFMSVDLNTMAASFNTSVQGLEKELAKLIMEGTIPARIDSHNKRLYARTIEQRTATFERALGMGDEYSDNTQALLLRMNLMRAEISVKPQRQDKQMKM